MWNPGWDFVSLDIQRERIENICSQDEWIIDAGYSKWMDLVLPRVERILCLDYSRGRTLWQLFRRTLARCIDRKEVCNGNTESLRMMLSRKSILVWHCQSYANKRKRMRGWAASENEFKVVLFKNPRQLEFWLIDLAMQKGEF